MAINLLNALAAVSNGFIVPIVREGSVSVKINKVDTVPFKVYEGTYLTKNNSVFLIKSIYLNDSYEIDTTMDLKYMTTNEIFGEPIKLDHEPIAYMLNDRKSFIEFLDIADNSYTTTGFMLNENTLYIYTDSLSVYDIENKEELDLQDKSIPVSLLTKIGEIVYIDDSGRIKDLADLDFKTLKEFRMC